MLIRLVTWIQDMFLILVHLHLCSEKTHLFCLSNSKMLNPVMEKGCILKHNIKECEETTICS